MKDKEKRNKKGSENTIGKIIYGFLLFMPLFAIGTSCLISTFNMSSKEEAEIHYKYETNEITSADDLIVGNIYHLSLDGNSPSDLIYSGFVNFYWVNGKISNMVIDDFYDDDYLFPIVNQYKISIASNSISILGFMDYTKIFETTEITAELDLVVDYKSPYLILSNPDMITISNFNEIESVETHNVNPQDVFYNSVDKVTESPLFNWAKNSIIYTTTNATCNALSITTPFIPLLLSYWLIISVMYFLYDIALMLIWVLHDRIHALKDSIT